MKYAREVMMHMSSRPCMEWRMWNLVMICTHGDAARDKRSYEAGRKVIKRVLDVMIENNTVTIKSNAANSCTNQWRVGNRSQ